MSSIACVSRISRSSSAAKSRVARLILVM
jgi:hypothetical protein